MTWASTVLLIAAYISAVTASPEVFSRAFHAPLLAAHDWTQLDFASLSSSQLGDSEGIYLTCGAHEDHPERMQQLQEAVGAGNVRFAAVDHLGGGACLLVYGHHAVIAGLSRTDWPQHLLPPALKVHPSVMDFLSEDHSARAETDPILGQSRELPAVDMLVVKFAAAFESEQAAEAAVRAVESEWVSDLAEPAAHRLAALTARGSLGSGAWARLLSDLSVPADQAEACVPSLDEMASDIVFYRGHMELRKVDAYLQAGGPAAKHCLAQMVHRISADHRVLSITGQSTPRLLNYLARGICQSGDPKSTPMTAGGLTGEGEIVGVADSGLNDFSCFFWDGLGEYSTNRVPRRSIGSTYVEEKRRKVIQYISHADGTDEIGGHGTHVCGTIAGNSLNEDYMMANGVAPNAKIAFLDVQSSDKPYLTIPDLEAQLLSTLYNAGARVFSNSWGGYASSYYSERCSDADSFLYQNPDTLVLFAAGNAGAYGVESVYSPCDAKNVMCVGSSDSRDDASDETGAPRRISHFSSMGPTFDGRLKPDVVGPGFSVVSAMSSTAAAMSCGTVDMFGTSMATPAVAGAALLAREYFKTKYATVCRPQYHDCGYLDPSGVLIKAVLAHSAFGLDTYSSSEFDSRTEEPHFSLGETPDPYQGFGQVAVGTILPMTEVEAAQRDLYVKDMFFVKTRSVYEMNVNVDSFDVPFRVTVVWYDPPGALGSSNSLLVNNLDLEVLTPDGNVYLGNGEYDQKNTIEQVTIKRNDWEDTGVFVVRVSSGALANNVAQYMSIVVTCRGQVTDELRLQSSRRLERTTGAAMSRALTYSAFVKSAAAPVLLEAPPVGDAGARAVHAPADQEPALRVNAGVWRESRDRTYWSSPGEEGFTNFWTSNKYEVDVDTVLSGLQETCFAPLDITDTNLRLFSVRMRMDGSVMQGNDAFVAGVVITAPNGEKVQVGGYHTYAATTRIWARSWPVQWTGVKVNRQAYFDGTRIVNMSPMGTDTSGKWSVCLQLLHAGWAEVHYVGKIYLAFDEIPMEDVSAPATIKGQLKADAEIIAVSVVCSALLVLALFALTKNRKAIYMKLSCIGEEVDDSSVSSVSSADPRPILAKSPSSGGLSDSAPQSTTAASFFKRPFELLKSFSEKNTTAPAASAASQSVDDLGKPGTGLKPGFGMKPTRPTSSSKNYSQYENSRQGPLTSNPLHAEQSKAQPKFQRQVPAKPAPSSLNPGARGAAAPASESHKYSQLRAPAEMNL